MSSEQQSKDCNPMALAHIMHHADELAMDVDDATMDAYYRLEAGKEMDMDDFDGFYSVWKEATCE